MSYNEKSDVLLAMCLTDLNILEKHLKENLKNYGIGTGEADEWREMLTCVRMAKNILAAWQE